MSNINVYTVLIDFSNCLKTESHFVMNETNEMRLVYLDSGVKI